MKRRTLSVALALALGIGLLATPAAAQQSVNFQIGSFMPRDYDTRSSNDVLLANLNYLRFSLRDMNGATVSGDWSVLLGNNLEVGAGVGYYQRTLRTVWTDWTYDDGSEIPTDLKLRIVPVTALVKFLPLGGHQAIQPYIGGGLNVYFWRYSETGDFVDLSDNSIYSDRYIGTGTAVGPVALAGIRARVSRNATIGVEGRYQWGEGKLPSGTFLTDRIDLGGVSVLGTLGYRF
jgi:opacity protein-like surface antigen